MYNVDHSSKIWIIALHIYIFKIVANDMPWDKSKSVLEFATPLKKRFVPSVKLGPGDVCNLLLLGFFEENVTKYGSENFRVALE